MCLKFKISLVTSGTEVNEILNFTFRLLSRLPNSRENYENLKFHRQFHYDSIVEQAQCPHSILTILLHSSLSLV